MEGTTMMIERAVEELEVLETHHPNRFEYLKLELRSFISLHLHSRKMNDSSSSFPCFSHPTASSTATTQASSTSCKKRRLSNGVGGVEASNRKCKRFGKDRVDAAIERAQACLCKIQQFKATL